MWYLPNTPGRASDRYAHGIKASNRADLMEQAKEQCPKGMFIKAITWQHGGSRTMWYGGPGQN